MVTETRKLMGRKPPGVRSQDLFPPKGRVSFYVRIHEARPGNHHSPRCVTVGGLEDDELQWVARTVLAEMQRRKVGAS